jgi:hypothetical protein
MGNVYVVIVTITNPPQYFWSQSYSSTIILEISVAFVLSFLNVYNKKKALRKRNEIIDQKEELSNESAPEKKNNPLLYFIQSFLFISAFLGFFDFCNLAFLAPDHNVNIPVIRQSALIGSVIALVCSIIFYGNIIDGKLTKKSITER